MGKGEKVAWGNGDGRFLYPPREAADGSGAKLVLSPPVVSFRLEALRDGIEDYEYFAMLSRLLKKKGAEGAAFADLLKPPKEVYAGMTEFTEDPEAILAHRLKLARAIEKCMEEAE